MVECVVYNRVSTQEQDAKKQEAECVAYAKKRGYTDIVVWSEAGSAWKKDAERKVYNTIKRMVVQQKVKGVVVWALDRWVRNKDALVEDLGLFAENGVKLHSLREEWLESFNVTGPLGEVLRDFLIGLVGAMAELESTRRSERVKMAYASHKGDWGRPSIPGRVVREIIELRRRGLTLREIRNSESVYYYDSNRNKKRVSLGKISEVCKEDGGGDDVG